MHDGKGYMVLCNIEFFYVVMHFQNFTIGYSKMVVQFTTFVQCFYIFCSKSIVKFWLCSVYLACIDYSNAKLLCSIYVEKDMEITQSRTNFW